VKEQTPMITKSRLKSERGWTDLLLKLFLPNPDLIKPNPNYKSGPPMQLFNLERIEAVEQTEEFKTQQTATVKRKDAAKKGVETKLEQLRRYVNTILIKVPALPRQQLIKQACEHYNDMQAEREAEGRSVSGMVADSNSEPKFIERICVNYLRHCLTKYEQILDDISGRVGFGEGYEEIRRKIFSKISEKHGWLAEECKRQQE
jgi:hypothetical protein